MIIIYTLIVAFIALIGRNREIGYGWAFVLTFFLSPIIGLIIILLSKRKRVDFIETEK